jgi:hypothetical protein
VIDLAMKIGGGLPADPRYLAPEQVLGEGEIDRRADIWSTGVLLYEMLLGALPFDGDDPDEISGKILFKDPPLDAVKSELPEDVAEFITKALSKEPDNRYENVTAALGDLLMVNEELEDQVEPAVAAALRRSLPPPPTPPPVPAAATKGSAKSPPKSPPKPPDLPPALDLFGKKDAAGSEPEPKPEPKPMANRPPPLPEKKPTEAAQTMPLMDGESKEGPVEFEIAEPEPSETDAEQLIEEEGVDEDRTTEPEEERPTTPEDEDERPTTPKDDKDDAVDPDEERPTEPVDDPDELVGEDWERDSIEGRTTLPAPSEVFEELDSLAVAEESRRVAAEIDAQAAASDAAPPPAPKRRKKSPTVIAVAVAVVAVAGFVAVMMYAFSGPSEDQPEVATKEGPEPPQLDEPEPENPDEPEPENPDEPEPENPDEPEPENPDEPEPENPDEPEPENPDEPEPAADGDAITITLTGMPEGAVVKINGAKVTPPIRLPKSKRRVTLGVYLTGYHSHWERFTPDRDRTIAVKMPKKAKGGGNQGGTTGKDQSWADNPWKK